MTKLTEHFSLEEMQKSETAVRLGLDNSIPKELIPNAIRVAEALEIIRAVDGKAIRITSCYRSPVVNKAVGGSPTSAHRFAFASDCEKEGVSVLELCKQAAEVIPDYDQIIYEFGPTGWMHIGFTNKEPRKQLLTAIKRNSKTVYLPGFQEV